ncbi:hypothetical protein GCM10011487_27700 [Steroidobacter agaridevorans]|uniref:Uncharacterized protein n=1 Tax=Steroidobacter agaridevorans TaxID=2695856 RepID=A0A829YBV4_9GAMM|nr:hypothetical protein [Steroidobacter agaridevorans]GFE80770.1 hypothetical protein GCM10011487_27700 [Steroidobacter agaridevorans]
MRRFVPLLMIVALSMPVQALAGRDPALSTIHRLARVEIFDRTAGYTLPVHVHENRLYVVGEPGHQYEVRLDNRTSERLLAVTSVDGVNVITGKTADERQSGYVLDAWDGVNIEGWRKSLDEVATFYFTRLKDSYAARTGRPDNVGVIGVAVFRERRPCCHPYPYQDRDGVSSQSAPAPERAEAPAAADESLARRPQEKLGTGHGHRETSPAEYVDFQRGSHVPIETIVIYYDSHKNLVARGVIPDSRRYADRDDPNPFPDGMFTPDPAR